IVRLEGDFRAKNSRKNLRLTQVIVVQPPVTLDGIVVRDANYCDVFRDCGRKQRVSIRVPIVAVLIIQNRRRCVHLKVPTTPKRSVWIIHKQILRSLVNDRLESENRFSWQAAINRIPWASLLTTVASAPVLSVVHL